MVSSVGKKLKWKIVSWPKADSFSKFLPCRGHSQRYDADKDRVPTTTSATEKQKKKEIATDALFLLSSCFIVALAWSTISFTRLPHIFSAKGQEKMGVGKDWFDHEEEVTEMAPKYFFIGAISYFFLEQHSTVIAHKRSIHS